MNFDEDQESAQCITEEIYYGCPTREEQMILISPHHSGLTGDLTKFHMSIVHFFLPSFGLHKE